MGFARQKEGFKEVGKRIKKSIPTKTKKFFSLSKDIKSPFAGLNKPFGSKVKTKKSKPRKRKRKKKK